MAMYLAVDLMLHLLVLGLKESHSYLSVSWFLLTRNGTAALA
jgi:hypothetical protein